MAGQQYLVEKPFVYNHKNGVVEQRDTGVIVKLEDDEALQAGDAVSPVGHDGPPKTPPAPEGLSERSTREELEREATSRGLDGAAFGTKRELFDAIQGNTGESAQ